MISTSSRTWFWCLKTFRLVAQKASSVLETAGARAGRHTSPSRTHDLGGDPGFVSRVVGLVSLVGASRLTPGSHGGESPWLVVKKGVRLDRWWVTGNVSVHHLQSKMVFFQLVTHMALKSSHLWPVHVLGCPQKTDLFPLNVGELGTTKDHDEDTFGIFLPVFAQAKNISNPPPLHEVPWKIQQNQLKCINKPGYNMI